MEDKCGLLELAQPTSRRRATPTDEYVQHLHSLWATGEWQDVDRFWREHAHTRQHSDSYSVASEHYDRTHGLYLARSGFLYPRLGPAIERPELARLGRELDFEIAEGQFGDRMPRYERQPRDDEGYAPGRTVTREERGDPAMRARVRELLRQRDAWKEAESDTDADVSPPREQTPVRAPVAGPSRIPAPGRERSPVRTRTVPKREETPTSVHGRPLKRARRESPSPTRRTRVNREAPLPSPLPALTLSSASSPSTSELDTPATPPRQSRRLAVQKRKRSVSSDSDSE
ncbi:hypothetical protein B0H21DRAFT_820841 [Amylocystis lapponica]|nr:hypothetical protein B0H21DRAFT_820841 [Amylocystis lapponica]